MMVQGRELRIQNHLAMICGHLWAINAVIMDAELRALKERDLEDWMADVGAAIDDLQVLLDGILDSAQARVMATASNPLFRVAIVCKLKKMARRLKDLVIIKGSTFNLRKEMMDAMDPCRGEYFTIPRDEVVGRDDDRDNIIEILQQQKDNSDGVPFFIVIRGYQMMGKTTLAQMIYHHSWVRQHFHHYIWVDMSKYLFSLDPLSIARECVESITGEPSGHLQHPYLQLQEGLGGSRYFLVLNNFNLWSLRTKDELKHKWDQLKDILLHVGGPGSAIIITTQDDLLELLGPEESIDKSYELEGVSEDAWVKLFMRHAFFIIQPDQQLQDKEKASSSSPSPSPAPSIDDIDLLPIFAKQFYQKYDGQPGAAKILGSIFRYTEVSRWQQLVDTYSRSDQDILLHKYGALMVLHHLPTRFERLKLYLSLFPEATTYDDFLDREDFVHMMIVEGLIPHSSDKNVVERYLRGEFRYQDWHEALRVTSQYYFTMWVGQDTQIPRQCHHLCLLFNSSDSDASTFPMTLFVGAQKMLKTLILHRKEKEEMVPKVQKCQIANIPEAMFVHLLNLRILNLRDSRIQELPSTVGKLLNLRYLNLSHTDIEILPRSVCNLGNLQILNLSHCEELRKLPGGIHKLRKLQILKVAYCKKLRTLSKSVIAIENLQQLDLEGCHWLVQLPKGFSNMKNLTELNMHKCVSLTRMPLGIGQLISLQKLLGFVVDDDFGSATQQELQLLVNLEELHVRGLERVLNSEDIRNIKLQEKPKLKNLTLHWKWWNMDDEEAILVTSQQQVLEDLQPKSALEALEIVSYAGQKLPSWMTDRQLYVMSLVEIRLINLKRCESLPPLEQLPHLKIVEISGMDSISIVDDVFYGDRHGRFPSLKKLIFSQMPALEKWTTEKKIFKILFHNLQELTLIQCPKFKTLEVHLPRMSYLTLWLNNNEMLLTSNFIGWHNLRYVYKKLEIIGCEKLQCLPQGMQNLRCIEHLTIVGCRRLIFLPDWLEELKDLSSLSLSDCPALSFIPEGLKQRVKKLHVEGCPKLQL